MKPKLMKKAALGLALLLTLTGCGEAAASVPASSAAQSTASSAAQSAPQPTAAPAPESEAASSDALCGLPKQPRLQPEGDPVLYVEPAVERFVAQRPDAVRWVDAEGEYTETLVLTTTETVTALELIAIEPEIAEDGTLYSGPCTVLQRLDTFTENDLLVLTIQFVGALPDRALRFVDAAGNPQCWYLAQSGEDGMPLLGWLG